MAAGVNPAIIMVQAVHAMQARMRLMQKQQAIFMERMQHAPQAIATTQAPSPSVAPPTKIIFHYLPGEVEG